MARRRYTLSLDADRDLDSLFTYLATHSGVERAESAFERIDEVLELLAASPRLGRVRLELDGSPRSFAVLRWIVFYEPQEHNDGIYVWRIVDGSRDLQKLIRPPN